MNLKNLTELDLASNQFTGHFLLLWVWSVPYDQPNFECVCSLLPPFAAGSIPESMGNLGNLVYLYLYDNKLEGHFVFIFGMVSPVRPT